MLDAAGDGTELPEAAFAFHGKQLGERGFPTARGAKENHGSKLVSIDQPSKQFALTEKMILADELIQRRRTHPRRQWLGTFQMSFLRGIEK